MIKRLILLIACFSMCGWSGVLTDAYTKPVYEGLPTNGLVLHYKFDEASWNGTVGEVIDSSGYSNTGTAKKVFTYSDRFNRSAYFKGDASIESVGTSAGDFTNNFSVFFWMKTTGANQYYRLVAKRSVTTQYDFFLSNAKLSMYNGASTVISSDTVLKDGNWHHTGFTVENNNLRFWVDGVGDAGRTMTFVSRPEKLYIGTLLSSSYYVGSMDDLRIYNRVLSSNEISQIYLAESYSKRPPVTILQGDQFKPTDISGLALWLDASDTSTLWDSPVGGSLSVNGGVVGRWEDKSGNNNHATNGVVANMPTLQVSGRSSINFDGVNDRLIISVPISVSNGTVFSVFVRNVSSITSIPLGDSGNKCVPIEWYNNNILYTVLNGQWINTESQKYNTGSFLYKCVITTNTVSLSMLYENGKAINLARSVNGSFSPGNSVNTVGYGDSVYHKGEIKDIIVYNRPLSDIECRKVEQYLSAKWAIPLNGVTTTDSTLDSIEKVQTPVSAVYQGNRLVYNPYKKSYLKESPDYYNSIVFTTAGYASTWSAPSITASTLTDNDFTWTRLSDRAFIKAKSPPITFFSVINDTYWVTCTDWSKVTSIDFANGGTVKSQYKQIDMSNLNNKLNGLTSIKFGYNAFDTIHNVYPLPDNIQGFGLQNTWMWCVGIKNGFPPVNHLTKVTNLENTWYNCRGNANEFPSVNSLTNVTILRRTWYLCSGIKNVFPAVSNLVENTSLLATWYNCYGNTNEFPYVNSLTNVNTLENTWSGCYGIKNGFPAVSNLTKVTSLNSTWYNCYGNTNEFPYVNSLTNVNTLYGAWRDCYGIKNGFPAVSNMIKTTSLAATWLGCSSNTNGFPYVNNLTNNISLVDTWDNCCVNKSFPSISNHVNVTRMDFTWYNTYAMTNDISYLLQPISWFSTGKCKNFRQMFNNCYLLQGSAMPYVNAIMSAPGYPTGYDVYRMFYNCTNLSDYASIPADFK